MNGHITDEIIQLLPLIAAMCTNLLFTSLILDFVFVTKLDFLTSIQFLEKYHSSVPYSIQQGKRTKMK